MKDKSRAESISEEILSIAKAQLLVRMRFLDRALFELKPEVSDVAMLATDGRHLYYEPYQLLQAYRKEQGYSVRVWGHMLVHCLFRHMFVSVTVDLDLWDLACDLAAEAVLESWHLPQLATISGERERQQVLSSIRQDVKLLSAEKIYRYLLDRSFEKSKLAKWRALFTLDDHSLWYVRLTLAGISLASGNSSDSAFSNGTSYGKAAATFAMGTDLQNMWQDISERIRTDMEMFSKYPGTEPGDMLQLLRDLHRERCDYRQFLKKFATRCEVMRISPDEFDYITYTLGLNLYKDMPLIEPLEYREDQRIRELVIAIDTSGSVAGDLVQSFLQKTYNILKQEETLDRRFHLHIIQCDADIQEDVLITTQDEFDHYIRNMTIRGLGGTDFRPVFTYTEQLRKQGQLLHLKGLLYFTDGYGTFPLEPTDYLTAFLFVEDDLSDKWVPPWAIRQVLDADDIQNSESL